jgi:hypothetical protein
VLCELDREDEVRVWGDLRPRPCSSVAESGWHTDAPLAPFFHSEQALVPALNHLLLSNLETESLKNGEVGDACEQGKMGDTGRITSLASECKESMCGFETRASALCVGGGGVAVCWYGWTTIDGAVCVCARAR